LHNRFTEIAKSGKSNTLRLERPVAKVEHQHHRKIDALDEIKDVVL